MPIYETMPDVFPPRVEPVNGSDLPMFASAKGDAVMAWTPPDGFTASSAMSLRDGEGHELRVEALAPTDTREGMHEVVRKRQTSFLGGVKRMQRMLGDRLLDVEFEGLVTPPEPESKEQYLFRGRMDARRDWEIAPSVIGLCRKLTWIYRECRRQPPTVPGRRFHAYEFDYCSSTEPGTDAFAGVSDAEALAIFDDRIVRPRGDELALWQHGSGFVLPSRWLHNTQGPDAFVDLRATNAFAPPELRVSDLLPPGMESEFDYRVERCRSELSHHGRNDLFERDLVPAHGHRITRCREFYRAKLPYSASELQAREEAREAGEDMEEDPDYFDKGHGETTVRFAEVAAGGGRSVFVYAAVFGRSQITMEGLWAAALGRLYVSDAGTRPAEVV